MGKIKIWFDHFVGCSAVRVNLVQYRSFCKENSFQLLFWTQKHSNKLENIDWYTPKQPNRPIPTNHPCDAILMQREPKSATDISQLDFLSRLIATQTAAEKSKPDSMSSNCTPETPATLLNHRQTTKEHLLS